jgi:hypothetical protein
MTPRRGRIEAGGILVSWEAAAGARTRSPTDGAVEAVNTDTITLVNLGGHW